MIGEDHMKFAGKILVCALMAALSGTFFACGDSSSASAEEIDNSDGLSSKSEEQGERSSGSKSPSSSSSKKSGSSSSQEVSEGWDWDTSKDSRLNPDIEYGSMTDSRDGKVYKTVQIGKQVWMAQNLNYADETKTPSLKENSWCFNNKKANCDVAGRLYTWTAAMDSICPDGWHLPNDAEWKELLLTVDPLFNSMDSSTAGKKLKSQTGWDNNGNGDDTFGFSALPAGSFEKGFSWNAGARAYFWSSTEFGSSTAYSMYLNSSDKQGTPDTHAYLSGNNKDFGYSVRCVEGAPLSSSSAEASSSSTYKWEYPKEAYLNPEIEYDSITDDRDGKVYKVVEIGDQWWMAENLNFESEQSLCYDNDSASCDVAGRLYTWAAAMNSICPAGWHLPSSAEWKTLFDFVGEGFDTEGIRLKSQTGWKDSDYQGTNDFGFSALPAGYASYYRPVYIYERAGQSTVYWTSTEKEGSETYAFVSVFGYQHMNGFIFEDRKDTAVSVRCVKD